MGGSVSKAARLCGGQDTGHPGATLPHALLAPPVAQAELPAAPVVRVRLAFEMPAGARVPPVQAVQVAALGGPAALRACAQEIVDTFRNGEAAAGLG